MKEGDEMSKIEMFLYPIIAISPLSGVLGIVFLVLYFALYKSKRSIRRTFLVVGCIGIGQCFLIICFFVMVGLLGLGPVPS